MRVYFNGAWLDEQAVRVSFDDRGFLFGDAVYEVIRLYDGVPFRLSDHLDRLERSLAGVWITGVDRGALTRALMELADTEGRQQKDAIIYIEVSRGASPRNHAFPEPTVSPTTLMWLRPVSPLPWAQIEAGISAITVPDDRWAKCWIKTVNLLPNVMAKEKAHRAGAQDALFVRDGMVLEGTSANLFIVRGGTLMTAPVTNYILPGITRTVVLELADELGLPTRLEPFAVETLMSADEVFLTGTTTEVLPVTVVDGRRLRDTAGPVARKLLSTLRMHVGRPVPELLR